MSEKNKYSIEELKSKSNQIRLKLIEMSNKGKAAHLGSALSCVDILVSLHFEIIKDDKDFFILSKGHAASAIYATLAYKGKISIDKLEEYAKEGSKLLEHPTPNEELGIKVATGSLGHGLPIGCGVALANKLKNNNNKVFVLMSDGECNEGSVWEAAMFASSKKLDNLITIIDYNKWQATGRSNEIMALASLKDKWTAFGWNAIEINGHNHLEILEALSKKKNNFKPTAIIANTIKGKGVSFMEDDNNWHYRVPTEKEIELSRKELGVK